LAKELGPKKIRVNSINPGGTETGGTRALGVVGNEFEKHLISQTPLGRFGQPEDIAPVAVFLSSEASSWVTGEILLASGRHALEIQTAFLLEDGNHKFDWLQGSRK
jgi:3-oxoacyl-[acyl-carrier protein] reductase